MKAALFNDVGAPEDIEIRDVGIPNPGVEQVLVRVAAAGVNPVDWKIASGARKQIFPISFPWIPGFDMSGEVVDVGAKATRWQPGAAVFGYIRMMDRQVCNGCYAEFVAVDEGLLVDKPVGLSHGEAASIPLAAQTAWYAMIETAALSAGETVLIRGAAGGVGGYAVQFAKHVGAKVIATASQRNHEYLGSLGADHVIDYHTHDVTAEALATSATGVDVLFDCVGVDDVDAHLATVKTGGRAVTIAGAPSAEVVQARGLALGQRVIVDAQAARLQQIAALLDTGQVRLSPLEELPLDAAAEALARSKAARTRGKLVLRIAD